MFSLHDLWPHNIQEQSLSATWLMTVDLVKEKGLYGWRVYNDVKGELQTALGFVYIVSYTHKHTHAKGERWTEYWTEINECFICTLYPQGIQNIKE